MHRTAFDAVQVSDAGEDIINQVDGMGMAARNFR